MYTLFDIEIGNKYYYYYYYYRDNKIYCRLDCWFVVEHLTNVVKQTNSLPSIRSNHNIIDMSLTNLAPLRDTNYINIIKGVISKSEDNNKIWGSVSDVGIY